MVLKVKSYNEEYSPSAKHREEFIRYLQEQVEKVGGPAAYDPVIAMALMAHDNSTITKLDRSGNAVEVEAVPIDLKFNAHKEVAKYVRPQLKQVELSGPDGGPIETKGAGVDELLKSIEELVRVQGGKKNAT